VATTEPPTTTTTLPAYVTPAPQLVQIFQTEAKALMGAYPGNIRDQEQSFIQEYQTEQVESGPPPNTLASPQIWADDYLEMNDIGLIHAYQQQEGSTPPVNYPLPSTTTTQCFTTPAQSEGLPGAEGITADGQPC